MHAVNIKKDLKLNEEFFIDNYEHYHANKTDEFFNKYGYNDKPSLINLIFTLEKDFDTAVEYYKKTNTKQPAEALSTSTSTTTQLHDEDNDLNRPLLSSSS